MTLRRLTLRFERVEAVFRKCQGRSEKELRKASESSRKCKEIVDNL